jgi:hypothetical protein
VLPLFPLVGGRGAVGVATVGPVGDSGSFNPQLVAKSQGRRKRPAQAARLRRVSSFFFKRVLRTFSATAQRQILPGLRGNYKLFIKFY